MGREKKQVVYYFGIWQTDGWPNPQMDTDCADCLNHFPAKTHANLQSNKKNARAQYCFCNRGRIITSKTWFGDDKIVRKFGYLIWGNRVVA